MRSNCNKQFFLFRCTAHAAIPWLGKETDIWNNKRRLYIIYSEDGNSRLFCSDVMLRRHFGFNTLKSRVGKRQKSQKNLFQVKTPLLPRLFLKYFESLTQERKKNLRKMFKKWCGQANLFMLCKWLKKRNGLKWILMDWADWEIAATSWKSYIFRQPRNKFHLAGVTSPLSSTSSFRRWNPNLYHRNSVNHHHP